MIVKSLATSTTLEIILYILFKNEKNFQYIKKCIKENIATFCFKFLNILKKKYVIKIMFSITLLKD